MRRRHGGDSITRIAVAACVVLALFAPSQARPVSSQIAELDRVSSVRAEFPVPSDPNMLFYIQRSVNSNTVVYAAHVDASGHIDGQEPVDVFWRWFNVDGDRKPLNWVERMMAYGVRFLPPQRNQFAFKIAAFPDRTLFLDRDDKGRTEALIHIGNHVAKLVYVYLQVDDSGLLPSVTAMDIFGIDKASGKALHEHVVPS